MGKKPNRPSRFKNNKKQPKTNRLVVWNFLWKRSLWHRILIVFFAISILFTGTGYGIGQWYINKHKSEPLVFGTTFISNYAESFGLDPKQTMAAILGDLEIKRIRLVSYWKEIEASQGTYDFTELDWQFAMASTYGAKVSLAVGLRQPRWPECHEPKWALAMEKKEWQPRLYDYMGAVVNRYKSHPALAEYQLENEFFMTVFGECRDFDRNRLVEEFKMVKRLDSNHPVAISRSNNWIGLPVGKPTPDVFGISVYKRVWDKNITKRYFEYPLPAWFYAMLAGGGEIVTGKSMFLHELQAEPWTPRDLYITNTPVEEQFKSMNSERMKTRIEYGKATGMRTLDLWGAEWWYWLKQKKGDSSVWDVVAQEVNKAKLSNQALQK
ncbi:hypothetical protein H0X09_02240 [Candidatus Saccharibacteria bacterium]|nr:hypothetical protein [Candidatus Saccharibacteria bacterium]